MIEPKPCILCGIVKYSQTHDFLYGWFHSFFCDCGRGSTSLVSRDDAIEHWNAQAYNAAIASESARFQIPPSKPTPTPNRILKEGEVPVKPTIKEGSIRKGGTNQRPKVLPPQPDPPKTIPGRTK